MVETIMVTPNIIEGIERFKLVKREHRELPLDVLQPGQFQPRASAVDAELHELAATMKEVGGIIQAIVVRPLQSGGFEILAGERRWRAARIAGLKTISCSIGWFSDAQAKLIGLIENTQRKNINPWEEANAVKSIMEDTDLTHEEVGTKVGKSRSHITNLLRLLQADIVLQHHVRDGLVDMSAAKVIMGVADPLEQARLARIHQQRKWSTKQLEAYVGKTYKANKVVRKDNDVESLTKRLSDTVGHECTISPTPTGKGTLTFAYSSLEDLENLIHNLDRAKLALKNK